MKLYELLSSVEIQVEYTLAYYDEKQGKRINIERNLIEFEKHQQDEIRYMYIENGKLYIELEPPEETKRMYIEEQEYVWHVIERRSKLGKRIFYIRRLTWNSYQAAIKEGRIDGLYFDNEISAKACKEELEEINRVLGVKS